MKRYTILFGLVLISTVSLSGAERGRGRGDQKKALPSVKSQRSIHSNAPGTIDRDLGRDRALEVGRGNKYGLKRKLSVPPKRIFITPKASTRVHSARGVRNFNTPQATRRTHTRKGPKR